MRRVQELRAADRGITGLWRRLRFGWRYRAQPARRAQVAVEAPEGYAADCAACTASCCRAPNLVSLRLADIARLHDAGLGWAVAAWRPQERRDVYRVHPELEPLEARDSFRRFPVLRFTAEGRCVFLGGDGRCAIYPIRPIVCRRFPYLLGDDLRTVRWASTCPHQRYAPALQAQQVEDAVESYNHKLQDLWLIRFSMEALIELGLAAYLPGAAGPSFAAALRRATR